MNPFDTVKTPLSTDPAVNESPKKESELRQALAIVIFISLMNYLEKRFNTWFGLSNPSALALAILSAGQCLCSSIDLESYSEFLNLKDPS